MSTNNLSSPVSSTDTVVQNPTAQKTVGTRAVLETWGKRLWADVEEMFKRRGFSTLRYLGATEVHTYAFSVAANFILAFFPFIVLLMTVTQHVLHSPSMTNVVKQLLRDFLPAGQEFIVRNMDAIVNARSSVRVFSLVILLFTSSGVFLPLEVALNRIWGYTRNRSYLGNQFVSLWLACIVGLLALISVAATAGFQMPLTTFFSSSGNIAVRTASFVVMKCFALVASAGIFFFVYWLLPNGPIAPRSVLPAAVTLGLVWELGKYLYIWLLPWLDFKEIYGPFSISVTLMFWAYLSGMLLLAGAHLSAAPQK